MMAPLGIEAPQMGKLGFESWRLWCIYTVRLWGCCSVALPIHSFRRRWSHSSQKHAFFFLVVRCLDDDPRIDHAFRDPEHWSAGYKLKSKLRSNQYPILNFGHSTTRADESDNGWCMCHTLRTVDHLHFSGKTTVSLEVDINVSLIYPHIWYGWVNPWIFQNWLKAKLLGHICVLL